MWHWMPSGIWQGRNFGRKRTQARCSGCNTICAGHWASANGRLGFRVGARRITRASILAVTVWRGRLCSAALRNALWCSQMPTSAARSWTGWAWIARLRGSVDGSFAGRVLPAAGSDGGGLTRTAARGHWGSVRSVATTPWCGSGRASLRRLGAS